MLVLAMKFSRGRLGDRPEGVAAGARREVAHQRLRVVDAGSGAQPGWRGEPRRRQHRRPEPTVAGAPGKRNRGARLPTALRSLEGSRTPRGATCESGRRR